MKRLVILSVVCAAAILVADTADAQRFDGRRGNFRGGPRFFRPAPRALFLQPAPFQHPFLVPQPFLRPPVIIRQRLPVIIRQPLFGSRRSGFYGPGFGRRDFGIRDFGRRDFDGLFDGRRGFRGR